jgi:hypothetical protein
VNVTRWALAGCIVLALAEGGVIGTMMRARPAVAAAPVVTIDSLNQARRSLSTAVGRRTPFGRGRIRHAFDPGAQPGSS